MCCRFRIIKQKACRSDLIPWVHGRHKTGGTRKGVQKDSQGSGQDGRRPQVRVLNTADTAPSRRVVYGCESPWIPLDNKAFLGSAVPERPSCIVPAAACHRFGSFARQQAGWFCDVDGAVPEKELLAWRDKKSIVQLRTGICENTMRVRNMCLDQNLLVLCKYPKNSDSKQANLFGLNYAQLINNLNLIR